jgi:formyl-CoA transferase
MSAPYQALPTSDGYVTIGANNEKLWAGLCRVIGRADLITDPRFSDNTRRMSRRAELIEILSERFRTRSTDAWVDALLAAGVPAGPIRNYSDVLDHDQHVRERGMISTVDHPVEGPIRVLGTPLKLTRTPAGVWRPPPLLGEHNKEILDESPADSERAG